MCRPCIEILQDRHLLAIFSLVPGAEDGEPGSLREALTIANQNNQDDTLLLASGTYLLDISGADENANATGDLDVGPDNASGTSHTVSIVGNAGTKIDASFLSDRVFQVLSGNLSIENVIIHGGHAPNGLSQEDEGSGGRATGGSDGGGILNQGVLRLDRVVLDGNRAGRGGDGGNGADRVDSGRSGGGGGSGGRGGGLFNFGEATIVNSQLVNNRAGDGGIGGRGGDSIARRGGRGGDGGSGGDGGAVFSAGSLIVRSTKFENNFGGTAGEGGRGGNAGTDRGGSGGEGGVGGDGGAVFNSVSLFARGSVFAGNFGGAGGEGGRGGNATSGRMGSGGDGGPGGAAGAIFNRFGEVMLANTVVRENATGTAGRGGRDGDGLGTGREGSEEHDDGAGGIYNLSGSVSIVESSLLDNRSEWAVGGMAQRATTGNSRAVTTIADSLVAGNRGITGGVFSEAITGSARSVMTITRSSLTSNRATLLGGGVAQRAGTGNAVVETRITDSLISNNTAPEGGGLYIAAGTGGAVSTMLIERSAITGNEAATGDEGVSSGAAAGKSGAEEARIGTANGGGIRASAGGNDDSTSRTAGFGGGVAVDTGTGHAVAEVTITDSLISANRAVSWGAVSGFATTGSAVSKVDIIRSQLLENRATNDGGAVVLDTVTGSSQVIVAATDSLVSGNQAEIGGGIYQGGGIGASKTLVLIQSSTISGNEAAKGGGFANERRSSPASRFVNSTISGNSADQGGGFYLQNQVLITNTTIADNAASTEGAGIHSEHAAANLKNTLVIGNRSPLGNDVLGTVVSEGHNLLGDATGSTFASGPGDIIGTADAPIPPSTVIELDLNDNGGPTPTHALVPLGLAVDTGSNENTENHLIPESDQRGRPRPADGNGDRIPRTDIGSVELVGADVEGEPLTVTSFVPTSTGFMVEFSGAVTSAALNLRDGAPVVSLSGATVGEVSGSLVVDRSLRRVTFIRTGGTLAADDYTVTLRSAAEGFVDLAGRLLDGDENGVAGGDFRHAFSVGDVGMDAITVGLPDFVRGPGQETNVPANMNRGIQVSISDGTNVRSGVIEVAYDPAYLHITGATPGADMPPGGTVDIESIAAGAVRLSFTSPSDLPSKRSSLIDLQVSVPTTNRIRGSQHILDIHSVALRTDQGEELEVIDDDALHVVSYFGDVSGDGRINGSDAALIARVAALLNGGFTANPITDPLLLADISGNGRVNAADAYLLAQSAALIEVPQIPPIPPAVSSSFLDASDLHQQAMPDLRRPAPEGGPATTKGADTRERVEQRPRGTDTYKEVDMVIASMDMVDRDAAVELTSALEALVAKLVSAES